MRDWDSRYSNDKIKELIMKRDEQINHYNSEIEKELKKEKAKYKFDWKRFLLVVAIVTLPFYMYKINLKIFPKDSIWSWHHYTK